MRCGKKEKYNENRSACFGDYRRIGGVALWANRIRFRKPGGRRGSGAGAGLKIVSLGLPIAALVGAGMVMAKPIIGAALMGIAAVGLVLILGFNFFSLIPVVLIGLGALLGFLSSSEAAKQPTQST